MQKEFEMPVINVMFGLTWWGVNWSALGYSVPGGSQRGNAIRVWIEACNGTSPLPGVDRVSQIEQRPAELTAACSDRVNALVRSLPGEFQRKAYRAGEIASIFKSDLSSLDNRRYCVVAVNFRTQGFKYFTRLFAFYRRESDFLIFSPFFGEICVQADCLDSCFSSIFKSEGYYVATATSYRSEAQISQAVDASPLPVTSPSPESSVSTAWNPYAEKMEVDGYGSFEFGFAEDPDEDALREGFLGRNW